MELEQLKSDVDQELIAKKQSITHATAYLIEHIQSCYSNQSLMEAIKQLRELTGFDLRFAKLTVEAWASAGGWIRAEEKRERGI
jgi:ribosomal protein L7/L12